MDGFKRMLLICGVVLLSPAGADELTQLNRFDDDNNQGRIGQLEDQVSNNSRFIDLNTQMIGINGGQIADMQSQLENLGSGQSYDFHDYLAADNISRKAFQIKGNFCGDTEVHQLARRADSGQVIITETRIQTRDDINCNYHQLEYRVSEDTFTLHSITNYDPDGVFPTLARRILEPVVMLHASMQAGRGWASASELELTPSPSDGSLSVVVDQNILVGIEDVAVSYNAGTTFSGCLKVATTRASAHIGHFMQIDWYCPKLGLVKRISQSLDQNQFSRIWELTAIN